MPQLERPGTIHDQFCRCRRCKPATARSNPAREEIIAILCMLAITGATCLKVMI